KQYLPHSLVPLGRPHLFRARVLWTDLKRVVSRSMIEAFV
ncbi:MAG: hypothetical protein ACI8RZ_003263, partial [Myxococcota bacterium]